MSDSFILRKNNSNLKLKEMSYVICRNQGIITDIPVNKDYKIGKINTEIEFTIKRLI